jgi:hypothetical protein
VARNRVEYEIRAQDKTKKATKSAKGNVDELGNSFKSLGKLLKGGLAIGGATVAFKKLSDAVGTVTEAYGAQQDAEIQLRAAAAKNPLLDQGAVSRLQDFASELQGISTVGDEVAISFAGMLGSFGRSEDEIRNIITAANDLAAATDLTLESAVRNLNKTFGGLSGELGELIPEIKDFTQEQLRSGEAVDFIAEKFAGLGEAAAQGVRGMRTQMQNAKGDLFEVVGSILAPIQAELFGNLTESFKNFTRWLEDNAANIYAVFTNIGPIMRETLKLVGNLFIELFTGDTLMNTIEALATFLWEHFKVKIQFIARMFGVLFDSIRDTQDDFGESAGKAFWEAYMNAFFTLPRALLKLGSRVFGMERDFRFEFDGNDTNFGEALAENIRGNAGKLQDAMTDALSGAGANAKNLGEALAAEFGGPVQEWQTAINEILEDGRQKWTEYHSALETATSKVKDLGDVMDRTPAGTRGPVGAGAPGDAQAAFFETGGDRVDPGMADAINNALNQTGLAEKLAAAASAAQSVAGGFSLVGEATKAVGALFDAFMGGFMQVMAPIINNVLPLMHGIFSVLGELIATFVLPRMLRVAESVQRLAQAFIWLWNNAIKPFGDFLLNLAEKLATAFDMIINAIITAINKVPGVDVGFVNVSARFGRRLPELSLSQLRERGEITAPDVGGGGTGGGREGTGNITSGRKITVNITINTDAIAGEGGLRELAVMIRDEIRAAEALGA